LASMMMVEVPKSNTFENFMERLFIGSISLGIECATGEL